MNLRPVVVYPEMLPLSPLRPEIVEGADMLIVRELTRGIYFGERGERMVDGQRQVWDTEAYTEGEIARIDGKLSNEKFVANANPEVVEAERERHAELTSQIESLRTALARVSEAG